MTVLKIQHDDVKIVWLDGWLADWLAGQPLTSCGFCSVQHWLARVVALACSQGGWQDLLRLCVYVCACLCVCVPCQLAGACLLHLSKLASMLLKKKNFSNYIMSQTKCNTEWIRFPPFSILFIPNVFLTHATLTWKRCEFDFLNDV